MVIYIYIELVTKMFRVIHESLTGSVAGLGHLSLRILGTL